MTFTPSAMTALAEDIGWRMVVYCSDDAFNTLTPPQIWLRNHFEMMCPPESQLTTAEYHDQPDGV